MSSTSGLLAALMAARLGVDMSQLLVPPIVHNAAEAIDEGDLAKLRSLNCSTITEDTHQLFLVKRACRKGFVDGLEYLVVDCKFKKSVHGLTKAIKSGNAKTVEFTIRHNFPRSSGIQNDAEIGKVIQTGNLDIFKLLCKNGFHIGTDNIALMVNKERRDMLLYMRDNGMPDMDIAMVQAIRDNNRTFMEWLDENNFPKSRAAICVALMTKTPLALTQWLIEHNYPKSDFAIEIALRHTTQEVVRRLVDLGFPKRPEVYNIAIKAGREDVACWFYQQGFPVPAGFAIPESWRS